MHFFRFLTVKDEIIPQKYYLQNRFHILFIVLKNIAYLLSSH